TSFNGRLKMFGWKIFGIDGKGLVIIDKKCEIAGYVKNSTLSGYTMNRTHAHNCSMLNFNISSPLFFASSFAKIFFAIFSIYTSKWYESEIICYSLVEVVTSPTSSIGFELARLCCQI
ncbi:hypothetical protein ACJX0J_022839, partial [Zea mays]